MPAGAGLLSANAQRYVLTSDFVDQQGATRRSAKSLESEITDVA